MGFYEAIAYISRHYVAEACLQVHTGRAHLRRYKRPRLNDPSILTTCTFSFPSFQDYSGALQLQVQTNPTSPFIGVVHHFRPLFSALPSPL
jgi:hypothetical protein